MKDILAGEVIEFIAVLLGISYQAYSGLIITCE